MKQCDYRGWKLHELELLGILEYDSMGGEIYLWVWFECRKALVESFPSVVSFNGMPRSDFIRDGVCQWVDP